MSIRDGDARGKVTIIRDRDRLIHVVKREHVETVHLIDWYGEDRHALEWRLDSGPASDGEPNHRVEGLRDEIREIYEALVNEDGDAIFEHAERDDNFGYGPKTWHWVRK